MRIALDTNRYTDFVNGIEESIAKVSRADRIYMVFIVLGELRAGFLRGTKCEQNESNLIRFLNSPRVEVQYADDATTHQYARLYCQLRKQGTPIPANDMWIAALVLQHGLVLHARDRHFDALPQLARV